MYSNPLSQVLRPPFPRYSNTPLVGPSARRSEYNDTSCLEARDSSWVRAMNFSRSRYLCTHKRRGRIYIHIIIFIMKFTYVQTRNKILVQSKQLYVWRVTRDYQRAIHTAIIFAIQRNLFCLCKVKLRRNGISTTNHVNAELHHEAKLQGHLSFYPINHIKPTTQQAGSRVMRRSKSYHLYHAS